MEDRPRSQVAPGRRHRQRLFDRRLHRGSARPRVRRHCFYARGGRAEAPQRRVRGAVSPCAEKVLPAHRCLDRHVAITNRRRPDAAVRRPHGDVGRRRHFGCGRPVGVRRDSQVGLPAVQRQSSRSRQSLVGLAMGRKDPLGSSATHPAGCRRSNHLPAVREPIGCVPTGDDSSDSRGVGLSALWCRAISQRHRESTGQARVVWTCQCAETLASSAVAGAAHCACGGRLRSGHAHRGHEVPMVDFHGDGQCGVGLSCRPKVGCSRLLQVSGRAVGDEGGATQSHPPRRGRELHCDHQL
mmetsp:Transcript_18277/g.47772  ORF Transcript_18277/g.47772 Transcript_18277/m.47772 type:complete len:298 (+) Transcript_18277:454-1347(+)